MFNIKNLKILLKKFNVWNTNLYLMKISYKIVFKYKMISSIIYYKNQWYLLLQTSQVFYWIIKKNKISVIHNWI